MTGTSSPKRFVVRLVGTAAAVALTGGVMVGTAPQAQAARSVWDRVAACESGGNWKINTGNGYYGGLQFSASTWRAYGGHRFGSQAHRASKVEQITIARKVLKAQGPGAWPVCSQRAGLTRANGKQGPTLNSESKSSKKADSKKKSTKKKAANKKSAQKAPKNAKWTTVRSGDTLGKIAKRHHVEGGWRAVWKMNKKKVPNPNQIYVGERLRVR